MSPIQIDGYVPDGALQETQSQDFVSELIDLYSVRHRWAIHTVASYCDLMFLVLVTPKPGPLVCGSPSVWYFAEPIALSRLDNVSASA
jgi:hypothetical protein